MKPMKYIVIRHGKDKFLPFCFPDQMIHKEMAQHVKIGLRDSDMMWGNGPMKDIEFVSAGFVQFDNGGFICFGESISLNLLSRGDVDAMLIEQQFGIETATQERPAIPPLDTRSLHT